MIYFYWCANGCSTATAFHGFSLRHTKGIYDRIREVQARVVPNELDKVVAMTQVQNIENNAEQIGTYLSPRIGQKLTESVTKDSKTAFDVFNAINDHNAIRLLPLAQQEAREKASYDFMNWTQKVVA